MNLVLSILLLIIFPLCSVIYVYKYRGQARFANAIEYLRKGWPIFAPLNVLLYMSTRKHMRKPFVGIDKFEQLELLTENWTEIATEAEALFECGYFSQTTNKANKSFYDVGFRTFYKYGWSKFYCSWYGTELNSALEHCPKTMALLKRIPCVNGAMFTLLPAGSQLTRHLDPVACSLRYHLGLNTPNDNNCFINVDGKSQSWRDGEAFIFDETYLHYVQNNTEKMRLILMCDIERPTGVFGTLFNRLYKVLISQMLVPNLPGDQAGIVNKLFAKVTPFLQCAKTFKKSNPKMYYPIKWCFNLLLVIVLIGFFWLVSSFLFGMFL